MTGLVDKDPGPVEVEPSSEEGFKDRGSPLQAQGPVDLGLSGPGGEMEGGSDLGGDKEEGVLGLG